MVKNKLKRSFKARHLMMMSVGGVIGAGYFLGAGGAIELAGPAVLIDYFVGGVIALLVTMLLAEMVVAIPVSGSFQVYARMAFNPLMGFLTGLTYWLAFLIGPASEAIAAGTFLHLWFPTIAIWKFCFLIATAMMIINTISAHFFGEIEFWLSLIKVIALLGFIILGFLALGVPMHHDLKPFTLSQFAPHGLNGIISAALLVIFAYGGVESLGTAAEESLNVEKDIPKVIKGITLRIIILYLVSTAVLIMILPWQQAGLSSSPFVDAITLLGGKKYGLVLGNLMNFVVLIAALSCIDAGIYVTSRMFLSLAGEGYFPKFFTYIHPHRKTPVYSVALSSSVLYLGALMSLYSSNAYAWLASLSGFGFLFSWLMIILSQPIIRKSIVSDKTDVLKWKAPFYPYTYYLALLLILAIFIGLFFSPEGRKILLAGLLWFVLIGIYYYVKRKG